jgi:hypothetical protein
VKIRQNAKSEIRNKFESQKSNDQNAAPVRLRVLLVWAIEFVSDVGFRIWFFCDAIADTDERGSSGVCRREQVPVDWATLAGFPNPAQVD